MPALDNLTVADAAATPVDHTFKPQSLRDGVARLVSSDGTPVGDKVITVSNRHSPEKVKGKFVLAIPQVVTETINGVGRPVVVRTAYVELNVTFDRTSTEQERKDILKMTANAIADDSGNIVTGALADLEGIF